MHIFYLFYLSLNNPGSGMVYCEGVGGGVFGGAIFHNKEENRINNKQ